MNPRQQAAECASSLPACPAAASIEQQSPRHRATKLQPASFVAHLRSREHEMSSSPSASAGQWPPQRPSKRTVSRTVQPHPNAPMRRCAVAFFPPPASSRSVHACIFLVLTSLTGGNYHRNCAMAPSSSPPPVNGRTAPSPSGPPVFFLRAEAIPPKQRF